MYYNEYMIVLYTSPGCASCRKAKNWLKENNLEFIEKNIFKVLLNEKEILYLISRTSENGTDDIISKRSKIIQENKVNLDDMTLSEIAKFVVKNPSVLKRPIIIDERIMQVGYNDDDIGAFIPLELRKTAVCDKKCPHYPTCGELRKDD